MDPIRLELASRERATSVVPYRGGYLAVVARRGRPSEAVVFDADGRLVRRLDGCVQSLVRSPDRALVAVGRPRLRRVGCPDAAGGAGTGPPGPDQVVPLPAWGRAPAQPNGFPATVTAVGAWGALVEVTDGIRGYSEGVYVVRPQTGEVERVPGAAEMFAVSPGGVACCVGDSLIDLDDLEVVGPTGVIEAWSPDGTQGLVQRRRQSRVDVVDTRSRQVLRSLTLPAAVSVRSGQWEDADNLTFELYRYSRGTDELFSTIVRVSPSGAVERVTGVTEGDPHVL